MDPKHLLRPDGPWLHLLVASESDLCDAVGALERSAPERFVARIVRGRKSRTAPAFFDECAAALQFPYYFGANWNAFEECLADLEWLPAEANIIVVGNALHLLDGEPADGFRDCLQMMSRIAQEWSDVPGGPAPRALHTVLHSTPKDEAALRRKLQKAAVPHDDWRIGGDSLLEKS